MLSTLPFPAPGDDDAGVRAVVRAVPGETAHHGRRDPHAGLVRQPRRARRPRLLRPPLAPPAHHHVVSRRLHDPAFLVGDCVGRMYTHFGVIFLWFKTLFKITWANWCYK